MPHVIYLHSALTARPIVPETDADAVQLMRYTRIDVIIAMALAGLINLAMLVMAASTFFKHGLHHIASLQSAHQTLVPLLGPAAAALFAIALLGSGLSSSAVGTLAGQVVMQGFIRGRFLVGLRRGKYDAAGVHRRPDRRRPTAHAVISQVVLSFGIPFALVPLIRFTARRDLMGQLVNRRATTAVAWAVAGVIICLNAFLLAQTFGA